MTSGHDASSRSPTPARQHARRVGRPTAGSRWITTTAEPKCIQTSPSEAMSASPATRQRSESQQQELKQLLLEGWEKGWLAMKPPACCARAGPQAA